MQITTIGLDIAFPRLSRISPRSNDTSVRRGRIKSCTKRFAAPDPQLDGRTILAGGGCGMHIAFPVFARTRWCAGFSVIRRRG
jgi:hypothetical protein